METIKKTCAACPREFLIKVLGKRVPSSKGYPIGTIFRPKGSVTCCKKCSRENIRQHEKRKKAKARKDKK